MTEDLRSFQARVIPLESRTDVPFDEFVAITVHHAREAFGQVTDPNGDVAPFMVIAEENGLGIVQWIDLDPELAESNLPLVVGSSLAAYNVSIVGLLLTVFLTRRDSSGEPTRQEALLLAFLQLEDGQEHAASYAAAISRSPERAPQLSEFQLLDNGLARRLKEALHQGLTAELDSQY
jgi:hypothetical protein